MQRQKRILYQRLRVPPAVNQFTKTLQNNQSKNLWRLLAKYTPEAKKDKVARLRNTAQNKADGKEADTKKPTVLKFGLNHVTHLVESGEAKLVVIAHDVDPIELVLWLPSLWRSYVLLVETNSWRAEPLITLMVPQLWVSRPDIRPRELKDSNKLRS